MTHPESYQELFTRLNDVIQHRDNQQVVYLTDTIFYHNYCFEVTSARAHALAMLGNFEQALCFAQQMIDAYPTLTLGYLAKGKVYSLYGYQQKTINIYKKKGLCHLSATTGAGTTTLWITNVNDRQATATAAATKLGVNNKEKKASAPQEKRIDVFGKSFPPLGRFSYFITVDTNLGYLFISFEIVAHAYIGMQKYMDECIHQRGCYQSARRY